MKMTGARAPIATIKPTPLSNWDEPIWRWPPRKPGQRGVTIHWNACHEGRTLLGDADSSTLLHELRALAYVLAATPTSSGGLDPASLSTYTGFVSELYAFMVECELESIAELDSETSWEFADYVLDTYTSRSVIRGDRRVSHTSMTNVLQFLPRLWALRGQLSELGAAAPPEPPFDGRSVNAVVTRELHLPRRGRLKPIPDEVAFPIMNAATEFLGRPASDACELQAFAISRDWLSLDRFRFGDVRPGSGPWRGPIQLREPRTLIDGRTVQLDRYQTVRHLVLMVQAACAAVLQSGTGMRGHELCSLQDHASADGDAPSCLKSKYSDDNALELFYVEGRTAKGQPERPASWIIGSRPIGSTYVPPTVQALKVLHRVMAPWRSLSGTPDLFVTFTAARGLPKSPDSVGRMTTQYLSNLQKQFLMEYVDLSGIGQELQQQYERGKALRGHQWRPTFALNTFRYNSRLIPALRDHFKHISDAVVSDAYLGNNAAVLEDLDGARAISSAKILLELTSGNRRVAGSMAAVVERSRVLLDELLEQQPGETRLDKAIYLVLDRDLRVWDSEFATCMMAFRPDQSSCHDIASTPTLVRGAPNLAFRRPDVCLSCACCVIRPEHKPFWVNRLAESTSVLEQAGHAGSSQRGELRVEVTRHRLNSKVVALLK